MPYSSSSHQHSNGVHGGCGLVMLVLAATVSGALFLGLLALTWVR